MELKTTDLPLAVAIAATVGDAAPAFDAIDVNAEAKRLGNEHPESAANVATIAEVISDQIEAEKPGAPEKL